MTAEMLKALGGAAMRKRSVNENRIRLGTEAPVREPQHNRRERSEQRCRFKQYSQAEVSRTWWA